MRAVTDLVKRRLMKHECENNELGEKKTSKFQSFMAEFKEKGLNIFALFGFSRYEIKHQFLQKQLAAMSQRAPTALVGSGSWLRPPRFCPLSEGVGKERKHSKRLQTKG